MKLKISNLALILLFHLVFIRIYYWINYDLVRYICVIFVGLFLATNHKFRKENEWINLTVMIYISAVCVSSLLIQNTRILISSMIYCIEIVEVYGMFQYFAARKRIHDAVKILYNLLLFYLIVNDIMMFTLPTLFSESRHYLLGDKFSVIYLHMLWIVLYLQKAGMDKEKKSFSKPALLFQYALAIFVAIFTDCATGIIGCIILIILYIMPSRLKEWLSSPITVLIVLGISDAVLIWYSSILNNSKSIFFIENILHRDAGLTGRITIYADVFQVINQRLLWGYGYNQSYLVLTSQIGAVNAQNGMLNTIVNLGLMGAITLLVIIFFAFKLLKKKTELYPIVMMCYVYIILSSVEITLNLSFLTLLAILASCGQALQRKDEDNKGLQVYSL